MSIEVSENEYILDALLRAGYESPFMCRQGWCLRCASKLVDGKVDVSEAKRYYSVDKEADFILICSAKPKSDLVIETHAKKEMVKHRINHHLPAPRG